MAKPNRTSKNNTQEEKPFWVSILHFGRFILIAIGLFMLTQFRATDDQLRLFIKWVPILGIGAVVIGGIFYCAHAAGKLSAKKNSEAVPADSEQEVSKP